MNTAETLKSNAQDYIHELAYKVAETLKEGDLESERIYNRALHTTIRAYLEAEILTEAEATKPVCEAYQEQFHPEKSDAKAPVTPKPLDMVIRQNALNKVFSAYESAAMMKSKGLGKSEQEALCEAAKLGRALVSVGILTQGEVRNQYVIAYHDYDLEVE